MKRFRAAVQTLRTTELLRPTKRSVASRLATAIAMAFALMVVFACADGITGPEGPAPDAVSVVTVTLVSADLTVGQTTQATAGVFNAAGTLVPGRPVSWRSSDTTIAIVAPTGMVAAVGPGVAVVTATANGRTGSAVLTIRPQAVASVTVAVSANSLRPGQTTQANAVARDASGAVLSGRVIHWESNNASIATVTGGGLITAVAPGAAVITGMSEGMTGTANLTVVPAVASITVTMASPRLAPSQTTQATAVVRDGDGNQLTDRSVAWTTSDSTVATVSNSGLITAITKGSATITAASESKTGGAPIIVQVPVANVSITLASTTLPTGQTTQATAVTRDAVNTVLTDRTVAWTSTDTTIASITATGLVTAKAGGGVTITGTSEGKSGTAALTVQAPAPPPPPPPPTPPAAVATVNVTLAASSVVAGVSVQATAVTLDANGGVLAGRVVTWSSNNASAATVSTTGLVTAVAPGSATITATSETKTGSATLNVSPIPVAAVTVSLATSSVLPGATTQATAVTTAAGGTVLTGRAIAWSTSAAAVATVDAATGLVTAVAPGTATITATSETKTGTATLTVNVPPVATVNVSLAATSILPAATTQATAVTLDARGVAVTGRIIGWSSSDVTVATVDAATGLVTAVGPGTANVIATSETKTGSAALTVLVIPVATVNVTLAAPSILPGATTQATAATLAAGGAVLTGRAVAWGSSDAAIATVDPSTGLVTAVAPGTATITATSETKTGSATLTVLVPPVATVTASLAATHVFPGGTTQASAVMRDARGAALIGRVVAWSSSDVTIATVNPTTGLVTGVAPGPVNIIATSETITGSVALTVDVPPVATVTASLNPTSILPGVTSQATAVTLDALGVVLTGRTVTWSSSDVAIATVNATNGLVTAVAPGPVNIIATSETKTGSAALTVLVPPVTTVNASLVATHLLPGGTTQASAVTLGPSGETLTGRVVAWSSSDLGVATVNATTGLVTAVAPGPVNITATSETKTGSAALTVDIPPVATVTASLAATSILPGVTTQASAVMRDARGVVVTGRVVTWTSTDLTVATVNATTGLVTAVAPGTATITATSETKTGGVLLTVLTPVRVVEVGFTTNPLQAGGTSQAIVTLIDIVGDTITGRPVTWSSSNASVATINPTTGAISNTTIGGTMIGATVEGVTGSSPLAVQPPPTAAPEPGGSDVILWQDDFNRATPTEITSGFYGFRGDLQVTDGHAGQAARLVYSDFSSDNVFEKVIPETDDVYFRFWYRLSPGADPTCRNDNPSGMKWFMAWRPDPEPRYTMGVGNLSNGEGGPGRQNRGLEFSVHDNSSTLMPNPFLSNINSDIRFGTTNDGQWHKYTLHIKVGSGGYEQIWVDGTLILSSLNFLFDHSAVPIGLVQFPGPVVRWSSGCDFTIDIDDFAIWRK